MAVGHAWAAMLRDLGLGWQLLPLRLCERLPQILFMGSHGDGPPRGPGTLKVAGARVAIPLRAFDLDHYVDMTIHGRRLRLTVTRSPHRTYGLLWFPVDYTVTRTVRSTVGRSHRRRDVRVEPEHIRRVVGVFQGHQSVVFRPPVGGLDAVHADVGLIVDIDVAR